MTDAALRRAKGEALRREQLEREKAARDAALGRRARALARGEHGPIAKRWVNTSVVPIANRLRDIAAAHTAEDYAKVAALLDSPAFGLAHVSEGGDGSRDLRAVLAWTLKGRSPGRALDKTTNAEDLVLSVMGSTLLALISDTPKATGRRAGSKASLSNILGTAAKAIRETALGQFITQVQGASAMRAIREDNGPSWGQTKRLDAIAAMLRGPVKGQLDAADRGEIELEQHDGMAVVSVMLKGRERRIELRPPCPEDWKLLDLARRPIGEADPNAAVWQSLAMMILVCAQVEFGWFDIIAGKVGRAKMLALSTEAHDAIHKDLERWLESGFIHEPMVYPPDKGDYLSVKHRPVRGRRGPMGYKTKAGDAYAWQVAGEVMADTAWNANPYLLQALRESPWVRDLAAAKEPDELARESILGAHRRLAGRDFYLPISMDFRGRVYTRPHLVSLQGSKLGKALLCFPFRGGFYRGHDAAIMHLGALKGLDKRPMSEREEWTRGLDPVMVALRHGEWGHPAVRREIDNSDEPLMLLAHLALDAHGEGDRIPIQIDGTCNGLQHLSALFRDETAAPYVNLTKSDPSTLPGDIYQAVAAKVVVRLGHIGEPWTYRVLNGLALDRKFCKGPVMVLPYGGTRITIEDKVLAAAVGQAPDAKPWVECLVPYLVGDWALDNEAVASGYLAFEDRDLAKHPLFKQDMKKLAYVIHEEITKTIPRAMAAMDYFRGIGSKVGERILEWNTGPKSDLWVVHGQAKDANVKLTFRGFSLPNSIRQVSMQVGKDEVARGYHRTGIVANFIHSQDAAHLSRTMDQFKGIGPFGAIHDCYVTRPDLTGILSRQTRRAFKALYDDDPLSHPVRIRDPKTGALEEWGSWYVMGEAMGLDPPTRGTWDTDEVLESAWFFS